MQTAQSLFVDLSVNLASTTQLNPSLRRSLRYLASISGASRRLHLPVFAHLRICLSFDSEATPLLVVSHHGGGRTCREPELDLLVCE